MPRTDPKAKPDGYKGFLGGVDSGRSPSLIGSNQIAFAVNCTLRGGYPTTRPGFMKHGLTFNDSEVEGFWKSEINRLQGAEFYNSNIICSISGRIFMVHTDDFSVREITPKKTAVLSIASITPPVNGSKTFTLDQNVTAQVGHPAWINDEKYTITKVSGNAVTVTNINAVPGISLPVNTVFSYADANSSSNPVCWMVQVEHNFIVQDGKSRAMIYDGSSRRSDITKNEVPTGTVMAYGMGRLWVATTPRTFVAGDINNGPTGPLLFTENDYIAEGGAFAVPSDIGAISGMVFLPSLDTSFGQGPLLVFTQNAIFSVNAPVEREAWRVVTNPIQTVSLNKYGTTSQFSIQAINGDLFYRSLDGARSFILARREFGTWGNVPISREMSRVMDDDRNLLKYVSSVLFDNRWLFTVGGSPDRTGAYFQGIGVLDFDVLSSIGRKMDPIYEGVWTGLRVTRLLAGTVRDVDRCFAFSVNSDGENELWEITKNARFDEDGCKIPSLIETRSMLNGSEFELTRLRNLDLWLADLVGEVDWTVKYRPDQYPCWFSWDTFTETQTGRDCGVGTVASCWTPTEYKPGYRTRKTLQEPTQICETNDDKPSDFGYEFQLRIEWNGHAAIRKLMLINEEVQEPKYGNVVC